MNITIKEVYTNNIINININENTLLPNIKQIIYQNILNIDDSYILYDYNRIPSNTYSENVNKLKNIFINILENYNYELVLTGKGELAAPLDLNQNIKIKKIFNYSDTLYIRPLNMLSNNVIHNEIIPSETINIINNIEEYNCVICQDNHQNSDIISLRCLHTFGNSCYSTWCNTRSCNNLIIYCPLCGR